MVPLEDVGGRRVGRIAVGIDFSPESETALAHAAMVGRHTRAHLILVHVLPLPAHLIEDSSYDPLFRASNLTADLAARQRVDVVDLLQEMAKGCRRLGASCEPIVIDDNPSDGLARATEEVGADLLVVGSHGRSGLERLLLGSVAERAVRLSRRDALVARGRADQPSSYQRVLVGTDFSSHAAGAIEAAIAIASPDATIELVHCWQTPMVPAGMPIAPLRVDMERSIAESGARLVARYRDLGSRVTFSSVEGTPADGLITRAAEVEADLVAVGSHGRRGVKRWLLGSVAESVIRHAACSILVARQPGPQGTVA